VSVDLLLLDFTSLPWRGVSPNAFASRSGRTVARRDFCDVPRACWGDCLTALIALHRPRMVGVHVGQPLDDVQAAIAFVRTLTDAPVIVGGYGFSVQPERILRFLGADFDVRTSNHVLLLDDDVPCRTRSLVQNLKIALELRAEWADADEPLRLDVFLGTAYATPESIASTVQVFEDEGLKSHYDHAEPMFYGAPALVERLGSREEVEDFLDWVANTFLSNGYMHRFEWSAFLARATTPENLYELAQPVTFDVGFDYGILAENDEVLALLDKVTHPLTPASLGSLFLARAGGARTRGFVAEVILSTVLRHHAARITPVLDFLGVDHDAHGVVRMSELELVRHLAAHWHDEDELVGDVMTRFSVGPGSAEVLKVRHLLYDYNVVLRPEWTSLLTRRAG
jgi:hypothetical protein